MQTGISFEEVSDKGLLLLFILNRTVPVTHDVAQKLYLNTISKVDDECYCIKNNSSDKQSFSTAWNELLIKEFIVPCTSNHDTYKVDTGFNSVAEYLFNQMEPEHITQLLNVCDEEIENVVGKNDIKTW